MESRAVGSRMKKTVSTKFVLFWFSTKFSNMVMSDEEVCLPRCCVMMAGKEVTESVSIIGY